MASENFDPAITFDAVAVDEKGDYWETAADISKRVWRSPWRRAAYMCRPTPGFVRADGRPGNLFSNGERGVDHSSTYQLHYSTLSQVAARSRALSLANEVRAGAAPRQPRSNDDLRPAVGRTDDGGWIYTGGWDDDLKDRPSARTLSAFKLTGFTQINDADPGYDPDDFVHIVVPDVKPWWAARPEPVPAESRAEACPSSSSKRRKRRAKRAREQRRLLNISPAAWDQRLSAQQVTKDLARDTSIQTIFEEMGFDPDEPLDLRDASSPKGTGGIATRSATKAESGKPDETEVATRKAQPAQAAGKASVELWLVDTGCGSDLIEKSEVQNLQHLVYRAVKPITFVTANGRTTAHDVARLLVEELGQ